MRRHLVTVLLLGVAACGDSVATSPSELPLGRTSLRVVGTLRLSGGPERFDLKLDGIACERLGWVNFYAQPPSEVAVFDPGVRALAVGTYAMGPGDSVPRGWLNTSRGPVGVATLRGHTELTSVTPMEVAGTVDWVIAIPVDTTLGTLTVRGAFRALRTGDACIPM